ncbi:MAG: pyridoxal phosphate-dependent aminotransferase [Clostridiales bacterium]|jgi:aspartate aminotransferase|nr:pyridoxal phosphate-dependent aminotransferase [Clostridiales bacterium]
MKKLSENALRVKPSSTLNITAKARELKQQGIHVISFGPGEPDFGTPENINEAAIKAIRDGFTKYTDSSGTADLRTAICDKLKTDNGLDYEPSQIIVSNGAKHSLNNIFMALLNDGDEVLLPAPFWLSYAEIVHMAHGKAVIVYTEESQNFQLTRALLDSRLTEKTKAIIINSPNNPTGVIYDEKTLRMIADFAVENDLYVISDEIYEKLIYDGAPKHLSIASLNKDIYERTIVVNGFSKSYSMTGWRVGYTAANKEITKVMASLQSHGTSNANSIAQKAATEALRGGQDMVEVMRREFQKRRDYIYERVSAIPHISAVKPQGAFYIFVNVSGLCGKTVNGKRLNNAADVAEALLEEVNVVVVPCADFGFENHMRLSYPVSMETIKEGMDKIEAFINRHFV